MKPVDLGFLKKTRWFRSSTAERWLLVSTDVVALALGFLLSFVVHAALPLNSSPAHAVWENNWWTRGQIYLALVAICLGTFLANGHYSTRRPFSNEVREVLKYSVILTGIDSTLVFLGKWGFPRGLILITWLLVPVLVISLRTMLKLALIRIGGWKRPMVIIGWGANAVDTALAFQDEYLMGYSLIAFLYPKGQEAEARRITDRSGHAIQCISLGDRPDLTINYFGDPHVVLALEQGGIETYQELIQQLGRRNGNIQIVPSIRGLPLYGMEVNHFFAHEVLLLTVRNNLARRFPQFVKRLFDIVVSLSVLVCASPLLIWIALQVFKTGRPIFYGHVRQGQYNQPFSCYKFRTMAPNAEQLLQELLASNPEARAEWEKDFKLKNDPRITSIGHFLRKTSLDELPQLWNVLRGDMSLVGPRPIVTAELERYGNQIDYYLEAKPGITGLWQISGRNDITYESRVYLDAWYVKNWSLFTDIVILLRTVKVIFRKDGAY
jgi:undecaprenyl-phosphate galactose phosphotransferase